MTPDEKVFEAIQALQSLEARDLDLCTRGNLSQLLYFMDERGASARLKLWGRLNHRLEAVEMRGLPAGVGVCEPPSPGPGCVVCPECQGTGVHVNGVGPGKCDRCDGEGQIAAPELRPDVEASEPIPATGCLSHPDFILHPDPLETIDPKAVKAFVQPEKTCPNCKRLGLTTTMGLVNVITKGRLEEVSITAQGLDPSIHVEESEDRWLCPECGYKE